MKREGVASLRVGGAYSSPRQTTSKIRAVEQMPIASLPIACPPRRLYKSVIQPRAKQKTGVRCCKYDTDGANKKQSPARAESKRQHEKVRAADRPQHGGCRRLVLWVPQSCFHLCWNFRLAFLCCLGGKNEQCGQHDGTRCGGTERRMGNSVRGMCSPSPSREATLCCGDRHQSSDTARCNDDLRTTLFQWGGNSSYNVRVRLALFTRKNTESLLSRCFFIWVRSLTKSPLTGGMATLKRQVARRVSALFG